MNWAENSDDSEKYVFRCLLKYEKYLIDRWLNDNKLIEMNSKTSKGLNIFEHNDINECNNEKKIKED